MTAKTFKATLERLDSRLQWVVIHIPVNVSKTWGTRTRLKVKGDINGFAFRTSLFPTRTGRHLMIVNKRMQAGAGVAPGSSARFRIEPDLAERTIDPPKELARLLAEDKTFRRWFDKLNYSTRKYIADWITDVKSPDARVRRAEQIAERLLSTMEAEHELPPILRVAFARNPKAEAGWGLMSAAQRRGHLMGIFYYRTPEARASRLEKAMEDAEQVAEKKRR